MPGRLYLIHTAEEIGRSLGVPCPLNLEPRRNIKPGEDVAVLTADGWANMRWGIIPVGRTNARGRPVMETIINARSETVFDKSAYIGTGRAVVPASGWYEWTGEKRKKTAWDIRPKDGQPLAIAAIWDRWSAPGGIELKQVATLTCEPNTDVAPIHHRMGVFLLTGAVSEWLDLGSKELLEPWPDGRLEVKEASGVDWAAP